MNNEDMSDIIQKLSSMINNSNINNQENTNQKQMSTNVQGVPFTVQAGKPVQMV